MKKILSSVLLITLACMFFSCKKEAIIYPEESKTHGTLDLSSLIVTYDPAETVLKSGSGVDVDNFLIEVYDRAGGSLKGEWKYNAMPEIISLPAGGYVLKVKSHNPQAAEWDKPYYYAEKNFDISVEKVTVIGDMVCVLSNVKVTIEYSSDLLAVMSDDCKVNVALGLGNLDFTAQEKRAGYFSVNEESNRLYAYFTGSIDGYVDTIYREIDNVKAGEWRIIRYSLKTTDPDGKEMGAFSPSLSVDVSCFVVEQDVKIPVSEDVIDDPNPSNPNPVDPVDPPTPPTPSAGPVIEATAFDITQPQVVTPDLIIEVKVTSEQPLSGMFVDIESTTLTADELEGVGLSTHLDLANPGEFRDKLEGLGFPVAENVVGQTAISFDITPFGSLLGALGAGTHKFIMTATDELNNKTIQTLTLITE